MLDSLDTLIAFMTIVLVFGMLITAITQMVSTSLRLGPPTFTPIRSFYLNPI